MAEVKRSPRPATASRAVDALARRVGQVLAQLAPRLRREQQRDHRAERRPEGETGQLRAQIRVVSAPAPASAILRHKTLL
jgi:hypothetical protein